MGDLWPVETDDTTGLLKFVLCGYSGPVKFTVAGATSTTYFDEGANGEVSFGDGETIHAIIPSFTRNVGFTLLWKRPMQTSTEPTDGTIRAR